MFAWQVRDRTVEIGARALVMGIVNVTPDSFSDGGQFDRTESAVARALEMERQGADILDVGGESTRPGAQPVPVDEELHRVLPVIEALAKQSQALLSVDTSKPEVADACLRAGAHVINDVTGLADAAMIEAVRSHRAGAILMHMQGTPATMQIAPSYDNVILDILAFFEERIRQATTAGIERSCLMIDPGVGFGKTSAHNIDILARLGEFRPLGLPLCLGVSRKGFLGKLLDRPIDQRLAGSLAAAAFALAHDAAQVLRVHDVRDTCDLVRVWQTLSR